jgi:putative flippase GtrA
MKANSGALMVLLTALVVSIVVGGLSWWLTEGEYVLIAGPGAGLVVFLLAAGVTAVRNLSGSTLLFLGGLVALFLGERMIGEGTPRLAVTGFGALILLGAVGVRAWSFTRSTERLQDAHRIALGFNIVALAGLAVYAATLDTFTGALLDSDDAIQRWQGSLGAVWPILVLCGTLPVAAIDRLITLHPFRIPPRAVAETATQWLSASLAIALIFPVNYLASKNDVEWDVAYFRTTAAGESTLALVKNLSEPIQVTLFFPTGSDVGREVRPYFDALAAESNGIIQVTQVDQALVPELAEELKIRDNGYVVFKQGDSTEKFKLADDLKKAKRDLKKLDQTAQEHLLKVAKGQRSAYFIVGHGEANFRERDDQLKKLNLMKKALESQNFKTGNLGVAEGLANAVPDDADLLILAAPEQPLLPEEVQTIGAWLDKGGAMLVMAEPGGDPLADLSARLGVTLGTAPIAHASAHIRQSRGPSDRVLLATNRFGSHTSVKTLAKNGTTLAMVMPTAVSVEKAPESTSKISALVRSFPDSWPDTVGDREKGPDEMGKVWDLAVAVTGELAQPSETGPKEWRAIVIGDMNWASDPVLQFSQGNQIFLLDGVRWLVGDDDISGAVNNEEDVKIQHTRDEDWAWFYVTVIAMPLLVLGVGGVFVRMRGRGE